MSHDCKKCPLTELNTLNEWGDLPPHQSCERHEDSDGSIVHVVYWTTRLTAIIQAERGPVTIMDYQDVKKQDAKLYKTLAEAKQPLLSKLSRLHQTVV